jgi:N-acetylneuraminic acid mutarotase
VIALTSAWIFGAALLAGGGWWLGQRGEQPPVASGVTSAPSTTPPATVTNPPATTTQPTPTTQQVETWLRLAAGPISGRFAPAAVWTGHQMLVWGGDRRGRNPVSMLDGAAYDPATNRWQRIPDAPQAARGLAPAAVWTGSKLLVWMGNAPDGPAVGATYTPATRSWHLMAASPLGARESYTTLWTGSELLVYGGSSGDGLATPAGAAYNPAGDRWRLLPAAPIGPRVAHAAVWTGHEMLIWGGYAVVNGKTVRFGDGAAYNPRSNTWRPIAKRTPGLAQAAAWTGSRMLVWTDNRTTTGATTGALYNPASGRWTPITPGPAVTGDLSRPLWTGSELIAWERGGSGGGQVPNRGIAYNPARDSWRVLPDSPLATRNGLGRFGAAVVWTGREALIWSGWTGAARDAPFTDGAAYRPGAL